jgi:hypothetical protein
MSSTVTNYSQRINSLYPTPGVDNDTQGFRDNFSNIKNALISAADELTNLQLNQSRLLKTGATVTIQGAVSSGAAGATILVNSATITTTGSEDISTSTNHKKVSVMGVTGMTVGTGRTASTTLAGVHGSSGWPYNNYFSVADTKELEIGSTFKFYSTSSSTYTIQNISGNVIYTDSPYDPANLSLNGVTPGDTLDFNIAIATNSIYRGHTAPSSKLGFTGDLPGKMVITSSSLHVCYGEYDGISNIWSKINARAEGPDLTVQVGPAASTTPNTVHDLSTSTRFYYSSLSRDLSINFINLPQAPYQVETSVVIDGGYAVQNSVYIDTTNAVSVKWATSSTVTSSTVSKYDFTIIGLVTGVVTVLGKKTEYV